MTPAAGVGEHRALGVTEAMDGGAERFEGADRVAYPLPVASRSGSELLSAMQPSRLRRVASSENP